MPRPNMSSYQLRLWKEPKKNTPVSLSGYMTLSSHQMLAIRVFHFEVEDEDELKVKGEIVNKSGDEVGEILLPLSWDEIDEPIATIKLGPNYQALAKCRLRKKHKYRSRKQPDLSGVIRPINFSAGLDRTANNS